MTDSRYYDDLETRPAEQREAALMAALRTQLANAKANAPAFARILADVDPSEVVDRRTLALLPVTRKGELPERQRAAPPFGGFAAVAPGALARIFSSPGPIYDPEGRAPDYWRMARALYTADLGLIAYESTAHEGLILDEGVIVEIVQPGTGDPVGPGGVGEVVVTTLTPDYPLIRLGTGDLSAYLPGTSPCGRTNHRIKGW